MLNKQKSLLLKNLLDVLKFTQKFIGCTKIYPCSNKNFLKCTYVPINIRIYWTH